jgi:hypothetical protein
VAQAQSLVHGKAARSATTASGSTRAPGSRSSPGATTRSPRRACLTRSPSRPGPTTGRSAGWHGSYRSRAFSFTPRRSTRTGRGCGTFLDTLAEAPGCRHRGRHGGAANAAGPLGRHVLWDHPPVRETLLSRFRRGAHERRPGGGDGLLRGSPEATHGDSGS